MPGVVKTIVGVAAVAVGVVTAQPWLVAIGISTTLQGAAQLLNGGSGGSVGGGGTSEQVSYDPTQARSLAVGTVCLRGSFVDEFTHDYLPWGGGNEGKNRVKEKIFALCDVPCDSLVGVWNGTAQLTLGTFDSALGYPITEYDSGGKHHLYVMFYSGAWAQSADAHLVSVSGGRWTNDCTGAGVCYVRVTYAAAIDSKDTAWAAGEPDLKFEFKGAKLYDPRKDSTNGGSGSHRWGTPSTYEWSDNCSLIRYNIIRGIYLPDGTLFYGVGADNDHVRLDDAVAAMNACDEMVDLAAGGSIARYRACGEIPVNVEVRQTLQALEATEAGRTINVAGGWRIFSGVDQTSALSFTDADIMLAEGREAEPKRPSTALINAVYASYTEPAQGYVTLSLPVRRSTDDIAEDGGIERAQTLQLDFCPHQAQAQRVMEIARRRARRQIQHTRVFPPYAYRVEPGDWMVWASDQFGYTAAEFEVAGCAYDPKLNITITLQQTDGVIFDWDAETDELPATGGVLASADPPPDLVASGISVTPLTLTGSTGRQAPSLQIQFADPADPSVIGFQVEYRLYGTTDSFFASVASVTEGLLTLPHLVPNSLYEYRVRLIAVPGRNTPWSDWLTFTSPDTKFGADDIYDAAIDVTKLSVEVQDDLDQVAVNTNALAVIDRSRSASDAALRALRDDVTRSAQALLNIQMLLPQIEQTYQRQLVAYVAGITGTDVTAFSARLIDVESAVIDLELGKATTSALTALDSQINTPSTGIAAQVDTLLETVALLDPSSATATLAQTIVAVRGQGIELSSLGSTVLEILNALNKIQAGQAATVAFVRNEFTAIVTQGIGANAEAIGEVGAILKSSTETLQASITSESSARVTGDSANASSISTVSASLTTEIANRVSGDSSNAADIATVAAAVTTESSARVSGDSANASSIASVSAALSTEVSDRTAAVATVAASVVTEASARVSGDSANASDITTIYSQLGDVNATGYFSVNTATAPGDASARVALQVSATSGGTPVTASLFMDALTAGGSRIVMIADKTVIASGSNLAALSDAFQFSGGVLYVKNAVIANLTAGNLADGAATNTASGGGAGSSTTSYTTLKTIVLNLAGGKPVDISTVCSGSTGSGATETFTYEITVTTYDGFTTVSERFSDSFVVTPSSSLSRMIGAISLGGSAGTCTVVVKGKSTGTSGSMSSFTWMTQVLK